MKPNLTHITEKILKNQLKNLKNAENYNKSGIF